MPPTLTLPPAVIFESDDVSESGSVLTSQRFPHTRAQLLAIIRQQKWGADGFDGDGDVDESTRISTSFVTKVAGFLANEQEDELKESLKTTCGVEDDMLEQHVLDLMHRHHDDVAGVPFLFLTPTRRPSRPSSRASTHSAARFIPNRPDTPTSVPNSPLAIGFRRPHTPAGSPLVTGSANSCMTARSVSPMNSPTLVHAQAQSHPQFTSSLPSSPISSPRLLSAKATEFKPIPRPLSAAAASSAPGTLSGYRTETPSPDLWSHSQLRATSNLAIAAPLMPGDSLQPRAVTPSSLRSSLRPGEEDEEDDPFDPFAPKTASNSFHPITITDFDQWMDSAPISPDDPLAQSYYQHSYDYDPQFDGSVDDAEGTGYLTDGMTPLDVLSSVFGSTLAPSELEDALSQNGYDFDRAMAWLVDRALPSPPQHSQPRMQSMGGRVTLVARDCSAGVVHGGRGGFQPARGSTRGNGRPVPGGNRVCRYYLAGECLRADCRFSHDLERALCRFWLRGTCAKQDQCEFLHHLPKDVDVASVTGALSRTGLSNSSTRTTSPPPDEFPALGFDASRNRRGYGARDGHWQHDPGRTRFAAAVKRPAPAQVPVDRTTATRPPISSNASVDNLHIRTSIVAPKPSPRIKLRPPALLPTLPTGESINTLYMSYRSRALQLGAARNACLSRAADAWRRGDGAAAKRFSREGHDLNAKMGNEMTTAASKLVRERAKVAEQAVKGRDLSWSDDAGDRTARGRTCGGGLGVCLGIASTTTGGDSKLTSEERTESMLDLHGLHSNEATDVLEEFLLALEREHFLGLAFLIVGEEKHTGTQDAARGASRARLASGVREWLHRWGYPWSERDGIICVDALTHG
ncbi:uncharacterized protein BJ212DRAFT_1277627 [Suillus subaureus]|uniref:Uncharacterized protein n=1 Tax=Suillus subaureus TaxID=48587 RepID=A0A9P7JAR8_9AGAM|nr:uncharacterized protein BJ212DRAFT_1277627 [Suillus subaureus]KAG1811416.1 hypothetical protein BJ212DRAFT_1277627 [Suillus subaureus]